MLFNSPEFVLCFLPIALAGFFLSGRFGGQRWALRWLVVTSLFFYGWWNPRFVLLLAGSIAANHIFGQRILRQVQARQKPSAHRWLVAGVCLNLALLGWFKYANFVLHNVAGAVGLPAPELDIFLPLAVSFFTFQQIMFLVESYREQRPDAGPLAYASFVAFFPHLIAGPIVRPREIMPQLLDRSMVVPRSDNLAEGLMIFLLGLGKFMALPGLVWVC